MRGESGERGEHGGHVDEGGCGLGGGESGREADEDESGLHVGAPPPLTGGGLPSSPTAPAESQPP
jgi:hypothetical protein